MDVSWLSWPPYCSLDTSSTLLPWNAVRRKSAWLTPSPPWSLCSKSPSQPIKHYNNPHSPPEFLILLFIPLKAPIILDILHNFTYMLYLCLIVHLPLLEYNFHKAKIFGLVIELSQALRTVSPHNGQSMNICYNIPCPCFLLFSFPPLYLLFS